MSNIAALGMPTIAELDTALASDAPRRWGLATARKFSFMVDPAQGAIWLLCPTDKRSEVFASPTTVIAVSEREYSGQHFIQIGSSNASLIREVYYFLCGLVDRAESSNETLSDLIKSELLAWEALLRKPTSMDRNQVVGLLGELWVLSRVLRNLGPDGVDAWTGPASEQHDFRMPADDVEVKTTLSHSRDHAISGLGQLVARGNRKLHIVSIQLKPAGAGPGQSLDAAVDETRKLLSAKSSSLRKFNEKIEVVGYRSTGEVRYPDRYCLRSVPTLVPVDDQFPRITEDILSNSMLETSLRRIRNVIYTANLDGLGVSIDSMAAPEPIRRHETGDLYA